MGTFFWVEHLRFSSCNSHFDGFCDLGYYEICVWTSLKVCMLEIINPRFFPALFFFLYEKQTNFVLCISSAFWCTVFCTSCIKFNKSEALNTIAIERRGDPQNPICVSKLYFTMHDRHAWSLYWLALLQKIKKVKTIKNVYQSHKTK